MGRWAVGDGSWRFVAVLFQTKRCRLTQLLFCIDFNYQLISFHSVLCEKSAPTRMMYSHRRTRDLVTWRCAVKRQTSQMVRVFYIMKIQTFYVTYSDSAISSLADELERRVMQECQRQESTSTSSHHIHHHQPHTRHSKPNYDKLRPAANNDKVISRLADRCPGSFYTFFGSS